MDVTPIIPAGRQVVETYGAAGAAHGDVSILLLGCGKRMGSVPLALREGLRARGVVVEPMDTGAACRTYNVLLSEERRVAAALIKIV
jgi:uncharacterized protein